MTKQDDWEEIARLTGYIARLEVYGPKHIGQINAARARISLLRERVAVEPMSDRENDDRRTSEPVASGECGE